MPKTKARPYPRFLLEQMEETSGIIQNILVFVTASLHSLHSLHAMRCNAGLAGSMQSCNHAIMQ